MRKNVFRKIAQSICIGAIGLLAGTSLDYAYSGYGILENPNLWAESTTTSTQPQVRLVESYKNCKGSSWCDLSPNSRVYLSLKGTTKDCAFGFEGTSCDVPHGFDICTCFWSFDGIGGKKELTVFTIY